jgi:hypothetical protein
VAQAGFFDSVVEFSAIRPRSSPSTTLAAGGPGASLAAAAEDQRFRSGQNPESIASERESLMTDFEQVIPMAEPHRIHFLPGCSRRDAIRQVLCMGAVASRSKSVLEAQGAQTMGRVDLHHHVFAPTPLLRKFMGSAPAPGPIFGYTAAGALEAMDQAGVSTAMLSCPVSFGDDPAAVRADARILARGMNEFGARMVADHKGRFGLFAVLPMMDVDGSLREIEYAFDTLRADGVGLMTSYGHQWLGDDGFDAVFDELNRRGAVVYSHPVDGPCCHNLLPKTGPQVVE